MFLFGERRGPRGVSKVAAECFAEVTFGENRAGAGPGRYGALLKSALKVQEE